MEQRSRDFQRIEKALLYVAEHYAEQPALAEIAAQVNLSEFHFQRLFSRWAGVTPKRFLQFVTLQQARRSLQQGHSVLNTAVEHGLDAPARLSELFVRIEAVSPGEYRRAGEGLDIQYDFQPSPFGECLIAGGERGITGLAFVVDGNRDAALQQMQARLPRAVFQRASGFGTAQMARAFGVNSNNREPLVLRLNGTGFQLRVWEALLRIPPGATASYGQIASAIGMPRAARAVGTAVGRNPVAALIPCHRVIRENGLLGQYHWGSGRKLALLGCEGLAAAAPAAASQSV